MSAPTTQMNGNMPVQTGGNGGSNRKTLIILALVVSGMVGLAYASVPLYQLFCRLLAMAAPHRLPPIIQNLLCRIIPSKFGSTQM